MSENQSRNVGTLPWEFDVNFAFKLEKPTIEF